MYDGAVCWFTPVTFDGIICSVDFYEQVWEMVILLMEAKKGKLDTMSSPGDGWGGGLTSVSPMRQRTVWP